MSFSTGNDRPRRGSRASASSVAPMATNSVRSGSTVHSNGNAPNGLKMQQAARTPREGSVTKRKTINTTAAARASALPSTTPVDANPQNALSIVVDILGTKVTVVVPKDWPCDSLIGAALAEYHTMYPTCEVPVFDSILHTTKKQYLIGTDPVETWCVANDTVELGMTENPTRNNENGVNSGQGDIISDRNEDNGDNDEEEVESLDFAVMFHRLPLGFTLKQENGRTVVATIYPKSTATFYERLVSGVTVVKIGGTPLEFLGLRQVHDVIRNATLPLEICFRASVRGHTASPIIPSPHSAPAVLSTRRRSVPAPASTTVDETTPTTPRGRAHTTPVRHSPHRATTPTTARAKTATTTTKKSSTSPTLYRQSRSISKPTNIAASAVVNDNQSHHGDDHLNGEVMPPPAPLSVPPPQRTSIDVKFSEQQPHHQSQPQQSTPDKKTRGEQFLKKLQSSPCMTSTIDQPVDSGEDRDSNQNDEDNEEMLVEQIKLLQVALIKKHEEAKAIARQLEMYHDRLVATRTKSAVNKHDGAPHSAPAACSVLRSQSSSSTSKVKLTAEVLEAIDHKQGLPKKGTGYYTSSNVSSVSGYSNYSNPPRSNSRQSRRERDNMRSDASVCSNSSVSSERRGTYPGNASTPRGTAVKNLSKRYNYMPQKYSTSSADAPTSLSSRGAVMSRARATRDSFITKSESPGVGYYDVKLVERVKGGEIGDSDRSLPWP